MYDTYNFGITVPEYNLKLFQSGEYSIIMPQHRGSAQGAGRMERQFASPMLPTWYCSRQSRTNCVISFLDMAVAPLEFDTTVVQRQRVGHVFRVLLACGQLTGFPYYNSSWCIRRAICCLGSQLHMRFCCRRLEWLGWHGTPNATACWFWLLGYLYSKPRTWPALRISHSFTSRAGFH